MLRTLRNASQWWLNVSGNATFKNLANSIGPNHSIGGSRRPQNSAGSRCPATSHYLSINWSVEGFRTWDDTIPRNSTSMKCRGPWVNERKRHVARKSRKLIPVVEAVTLRGWDFENFLFFCFVVWWVLLADCSSKVSTHGTCLNMVWPLHHIGDWLETIHDWLHDDATVGVSSS